MGKMIHCPINFLGQKKQSTTDRMTSTVEIHSLTVLEARSPRPRCWQGWFLLKAVVENWFHSPSQFLMVFWQFLAFNDFDYLNPISVVIFPWHLLEFLYKDTLTF
jgi:hypothetical protein